MWEAIRTVTDSHRSSPAPIELLKIEHCPSKSINSVNTFFANVGQTLASKIRQCVRSTQPTTNNKQSMVNSLGLLTTDEEEVLSIIKDLRVDSAPGWDNIPPNLVKAASHALVKPITHICNLALSTGTFPKALKKAIVHPIHKSGDRDGVTNYRPISVLPVISKILEKILYKNLSSFLDKYEIISKNQFGFRKGLSTEDAVTALLDIVVDKLDSKQKCLGIFLDLSKAFDTVSVPILLAKLESIGVRGDAHKIFKDFLMNRTQFVKIEHTISSEESLNYGVPQGSLLSPLLFQIYVNDLCTLSLPSTHILAYADDTVILSHGNDWVTANKSAENALRETMVWLANNSLTLNISKTHFVTFGLRPSLLPPVNSMVLKAHVCASSDPQCTCPSVSRAPVVKYLGLQVDACLSWHYQLDTLSARVRKLIYVFKKLRLSAHREVLKMAYCALCESILTYCITAWGGAAKTAIIQVERAQRAVIKVLLNKPFRFPTHLLYTEYKVLTVQQLFIYRAVIRKHSNLPLVISNPSTSRRRPEPPCPTKSRHTTFAKRHYLFLSALTYNKLNQILNIHSLNTFHCKSKIKEYLLTLDYTKTEDLLKSQYT